MVSGDAIGCEDEGEELELELELGIWSWIVCRSAAMFAKLAPKLRCPSVAN